MGGNKALKNKKSAKKFKKPEAEGERLIGKKFKHAAKEKKIKGVAKEEKKKKVPEPLPSDTDSETLSDSGKENVESAELEHNAVESSEDEEKFDSEAEQVQEEFNEDEDEDDEDEDEEDVAKDEDSDEPEEEVPEEVVEEPSKKLKKVKAKKAKQMQEQAEPAADSAEATDEAQPTSRVFISNLSRNSTHESVTEFFEAKKLKLVDLFLPMANGRIKGFGFAEFEDVASATKAVALSESSLDGNQVGLSYAKPRKSVPSFLGDTQETNILFVKNLQPNTSKESLTKHFAGADDIRVMCHPDGTCKGHAYVEFPTLEAAQEVKAKMANFKIDGSQIIIDFATPRGSNRYQRGGFRGSNQYGDRQRGDRGSRGAFRGRSFNGEGRFGQKTRGAFGQRGNRGDRGRFRGGRARATHVQFNDD